MARDRSAGALPVLITPEYTAQARELLGEGPLLDSVVAWGDVDTVTARLVEYRKAGADHIALSVLTGITGPQPIDEWRALAGVLLGS